MKNLELSPTMIDTIEWALANGGKLIRYAGGYWTVPNCPVLDGVPGRYVRRPTIDGLKKRGHLTFTQFRKGKTGDFAVECIVHAQPATGEAAA